MKAKGKKILQAVVWSVIFAVYLVWLIPQAGSLGLIPLIVAGLLCIKLAQAWSNIVAMPGKRH